MGREMMNEPLAGLPFAAIDFESAGSAPGETDQPVQIGIVRVENLFAEELCCFDSYIACNITGYYNFPFLKHRKYGRLFHFLQSLYLESYRKYD